MTITKVGWRRGRRTRSLIAALRFRRDTISSPLISRPAGSRAARSDRGRADRPVTGALTPATDGEAARFRVGARPTGPDSGD